MRSVGANVSLKSMPYTYVNPRALILALKRMGLPFASVLTFRTYLLLMTLRFLGQGTSSHVPFFKSEATSSVIA